MNHGLAAKGEQGAKREIIFMIKMAQRTAEIVAGR